MKKVMPILVISIIVNCALVLCAENLYGQSTPTYGQDYLGLQQPNFNAKLALPYLQEHSALGSLDHTFGSTLTNAYSLLDSGNFDFYRVHLINISCVANQNCGRYEIGYGYSLATLNTAVINKTPKIINFVKDRSEEYCRLQLKYPKVKLLISPALEHRFSNKAYRILADAVLNRCPNVQLVNNPVTGKGERYKGAWIEAHATSVPADVYSWDGMEVTDGDIGQWKTRVKSAKIAFVWTRSFNGRASGGSFVDPRSRDNFPSAKTFELVSHITDDQPRDRTPTFRCSFKSLSAPSIWKPLAEDYPNVTDRRANLPVAIVPFKPKVAIAVVGIKGSSIGGLAYYGAYSGNLNRYYSGTGSGMSGYQFQKKALSLDGSPWTYLKQDNQCIGPFLSGRRGGLKR